MEANRKERCDFDIVLKGETWHIDMAWIGAGREVAWYDGTTHRDGVAFHRIFSPTEIKAPSGRSYLGHFTPWFQPSSDTWIKTTMEE